jgi:hypothetical protein
MSGRTSPHFQSSKTGGTFDERGLKLGILRTWDLPRHIIAFGLVNQPHRRPSTRINGTVKRQKPRSPGPLFSLTDSSLVPLFMMLWFSMCRQMLRVEDPWRRRVTIQWQLGTRPFCRLPPRGRKAVRLGPFPLRYLGLMDMKPWGPQQLERSQFTMGEVGHGRERKREIDFPLGISRCFCGYLNNTYDSPDRSFGMRKQNHSIKPSQMQTPGALCSPPHPMIIYPHGGSTHWKFCRAPVGSHRNMDKRNRIPNNLGFCLHDQLPCRPALCRPPVDPPRRGIALIEG